MVINLFKNIRIRNAFIFAIIFMLANIFIDTVGAGKSDLIGSLNSFVTVAISGLGTAFCWYYWSILNRADTVKKVWRYLGIGITMWAIAEAIWWIYTLTGKEIPYPSIADLLWVTGYIFIFLPFYLLYRLLQIKPNAETIVVIFGFAIVYIFVVVFYVVGPIVQDPASSVFDKALGAIYPIGDLLVALGALLLALALLGGSFSWVWTFIALGFLSQTFSDTLFTYADWNGLYMPDGSLNFLSILIDMTYVLGYILVALGIYIQIEFTLHDIDEPLVERYRSIADDQNAVFTPVKITIFTDAENKIISASQTMAYLLPAEKDLLDLYGTPFNQVLGLDFEYTHQMFEDMIQKGFLQSRSINVETMDHQSLKAQISGIANFNVASRYIGSDFIITIHVKTDALKTGDAPELIDSSAFLLASEESIEEKLVSVFFEGKLHALYMVISRFGGTNVAKSMQRIFNANARRLNVAVQMDGPNIIFESKLHDLALYRELLKGAINYAIAITSLEVIGREVSHMEDGLDPALIQAGKEAGFYGLTLEKS